MGNEEKIRWGSVCRIKSDSLEYFIDPLISRLIEGMNQSYHCINYLFADARDIEYAGQIFVYILCIVFISIKCFSSYSSIN